MNLNKKKFGNLRLHGVGQVFLRTSSQLVRFRSSTSFCPGKRTNICTDREVSCKRKPYPYKNLYE